MANEPLCACRSVDSERASFCNQARGQVVMMTRRLMRTGLGWREEIATMAARRWVSAVAAITITFAVAVQTALAIGGAPQATATPEAPERRESIDPGFFVRFDG